MILCGSRNDDFDNVVFLVEYHPYWLPGRVRNPGANANTYRVMDLKARKGDVIDGFVAEMDSCVEKGIVIACVPSHDPQVTDTGIRRLAQAVAARQRIDGTTCLVRHKAVTKKSGGGARNLDVELNSIRVADSRVVKGALILLLDDVTTTGNSLEACKRLLIQAGALHVQKMAIGRTV